MAETNAKVKGRTRCRSPTNDEEILNRSPMIEDLINPTPVPDAAFTVGQLREVSQVLRWGGKNASESGDTITLEPLEEIDLE